jgi:transposase
MIPPEHPVRFVGTFIDEIDLPGWRDFGIEPEALGAPSYAPRLLLGVWCYGFMVGIRSCRRLEAACRDNLAFLWLTGLQPESTDGRD